MENKLRTNILKELKKVNKNNAPNIQKLIATKSGYQSVENKIIVMVLQDGITPSAAIAQIEMESM